MLQSASTTYNARETQLLDLYRMMLEAQNGQAIMNMAKQFGISQEQAEAAIKATLPAFSMGLKQNTADPTGMQAFMEALGKGQHLKYFEDAGALFNPSGQQEGNDILAHLFGSKEVSRVVADQASEVSGLGAELIKKMLPLIASIIMGAMFRQSQTGGMQDMINDIIRQMTGGGSRPPQRPADSPAPESQGRPTSNDPFGDMFRDIIGGMTGGASAGGRPSSGNDSTVDMPELPQTGADLFGKMFESGVEASNNMQQNQARAMEQMMEAFFPKKR